MRYTAERIRIFIGTEPKTEIARRVLECSIERHTDMKVEFVPMIGPQWEYSLEGITVGTGFSLRRWMIPAACGWKGRAIYMDADQLVFSDVWDLWTQPEQIGNKDAVIWCTYQPDKFNNKPWPQTSVMVIDCAKAESQWGFHINAVLKSLRENTAKLHYADIMHADWLKPKPAEIERCWNHLNGFKPGYTKLLHYTKENEQPWYNPQHPYAREWQMELSVAINAKYVTEDMLKEALAKWQMQEDWRSCNGLHPDYKRYLASFLKQGKKKQAS